MYRRSVTRERISTYDQFVNGVIVTRNTPLDSPIKNNAFQLFKITKRCKALQPKVPLLKASISLFGQLYIATTERRGDNCDLDTFFAHEAHWRMEMRRCIIRQNPTSSTASRRKQKLYRMVQRRQTPSSSTIAWFQTAASLFTSSVLEELELSSSSRRASKHYLTGPQSAQLIFSGNNELGLLWVTVA